MVYDFQAGGFSPLINPLAINKSTKQWDSLALGDTPLITRDHRHIELKILVEKT